MHYSIFLYLIEHAVYKWRFNIELSDLETWTDANNYERPILCVDEVEDCPTYGIPFNSHNDYISFTKALNEYLEDGDEYYIYLTMLDGKEGWGTIYHLFFDAPYDDKDYKVQIDLGRVEYIGKRRSQYDELVLTVPCFVPGLEERIKSFINQLPRYTLEEYEVFIRNHFGFNCYGKLQIKSQ